MKESVVSQVVKCYNENVNKEWRICMESVLMNDHIILNSDKMEPESILEEMIDVLENKGIVVDREQFKQDVKARELQASTGVGDGIAMPHAKSKAVSKPAIVFLRSVTQIDYNSIDGQPVNLFFLIAVPDAGYDAHLKIIGDLATKLMKRDIIDVLRNSDSEDEVFQVLTQKEMAPSLQVAEAPGEKYIIAVTACPTGIAHTYMAAEKLKETAQTLGYEVKVETRGASGVDNELTREDIKRADGIIVAADREVPMDRFHGKKVLSVPVTKAVHEPKMLFEKVVGDSIPIFQASNGKSEQNSGLSDETVGRKIYKHLMNGVSNMLPLVIAGGILIALAFAADQIIGLPQDKLGSLGSYTHPAKVLMALGGQAFGLMLPVLAAFIAASIADKPGMIAGFVSGLVVKMGFTISNLGPDNLVSAGFLGAIVAGFVAGYTVYYLNNGLTAVLPRSLSGIKSILLLPVLGVLISGLIMLILNIPLGSFNTMLNNFLGSLSGTNAVLLGILLGGMMAVDMGGPVNKTAYVFATGTLLSTGGASPVMAAVMAAGMVPPIAIAISTILTPKKYTSTEKETKFTNFIMGASFITEGAIPFAAAYPLQVIPSIIIGSAITGGLSMLFGVASPAPHGGIFVIALLTNPLGFLGAILIGSIVGAMILSALKKTPIAEQ